MAETVREFLVSIGFQIDESQERRFTQSLEGAVVRANLLADAIEAMAQIAVDKVAETAQQFEHLHYQAQRIGASEVSIRAFGFAISQVGGNVESANASLQGFGDFLAKTPHAAEAIARQLNIPLKDTADKGKFLLEIYEQLSHKDRAFADPFREAYHLGDDETFLAGRRKDAQGFYDKEKAREQEAGIGPGTGDASVKLMREWRDFTQAMDDYYIQAQTNLSTHISNGLEQLNKYVDENHKKISGFVDFMTSDKLFSEPYGKEAREYGESIKPDEKMAAAEMKFVTDDLHAFEAALGPVVRWFERWGRAIASFFGMGASAGESGGGGSEQATGGGIASLWNSAKRALGFSTAPSGIQARAVGGKPEGPEADLAKQAYAYWRKEGLSHDQALSVLGNERGENALGSRTVGDGGTAFGQAQWHSDRVADILQNTGIDVRTAGFMDQQKAMRWEMEHGRGGGHVWEALKRSKGDDGVDIMVNGFERPADRPGAIGTRKGFAARYGRILKDPRWGDAGYEPRMIPPAPPEIPAAPKQGWEHGPAMDQLNNFLPTAGSTDNSKSGVVNQTNTIHVTTSDPAAAAAMVGTHLDRTGADISRNLQGAFQ